MTVATRLRSSSKPVVLTTPTQVAGLGVWFKADGITGLVDTDPVVTWPDDSGAGRDLTQGTAGARPVWRTNVINGKAVVRFDGTSDWMATASIASSALSAASAINIWIVQKQLSPNANNCTVMFDAPDNTNRFGSLLSYSDTLYFDHGDVSGGGRISGAQPGGWDDAFHLVELYRSGATGQVNVDGAAAVASTFTDDLGAASAVLQVGKANIEFLYGDLAELLVYNRAPTAFERAFLKSYLATKYNLTVV